MDCEEPEIGIPVEQRWIEAFGDLEKGQDRGAGAEGVWMKHALPDSQLARTAAERIWLESVIAEKGMKPTWKHHGAGRFSTSNIGGACSLWFQARRCRGGFWGGGNLAHLTPSWM